MDCYMVANLKLALVSDRIGNPAPGVERMAAILNAFAAQPGARLSFTDLQKSTGLNRATCHAILTGFTEAAYLIRGNDKRFSIGPGLARIATAAANGLPPLEWALPEMQLLANDLDAVCSAIIFIENHVIVREQARPRASDKWSIARGSRLPLRPPFGATTFMYSNDVEIDAWISALSPPPAATLCDLFGQSLHFARKQGFAVIERASPASGRAFMGSDWLYKHGGKDQPINVITALPTKRRINVASMVCPVLDEKGKVALVLSANGFTAQFSANEICLMGARLQTACAVLSKRLQ